VIGTTKEGNVRLEKKKANMEGILSGNSFFNYLKAKA